MNRKSTLLRWGGSILFCFWLSLPVMAQVDKPVKITATFYDTPLELVLLTIGVENGLEIQFEQADVSPIMIKRIRLVNKTVPEAMLALLKGTDLHFIMEGPHSLKVVKEDAALDFLSAKVPPPEAPQQLNFTLTGKVIDEVSGESLPNATIWIENTSVGAISNLDGFFTLFNVPSDTSVILVSYIGYQAGRIRLNPEKATKNLVLALRTDDYLLEEVVIEAENAQMVRSKGISHIAVSPTQIAHLPSLGEKDIFRSLQLLPGISGTNETSSGLFVRGGTPDQNLILLDGFTVYHVDHFFGFFSAFNAEAIKDVQLYKGGFEAKYGGRLSSVVDLTGKNGNKNQFDMGIGLSALSANLRVESPLGEDLTLFVAGRRSYTDIIQSGLYNKINDLVGPETISQGPGGGGPRTGRFGNAANVVEPSFYFYDLNSKLTYTPGSKDVFSFSFYNGKDNLDNSFDNNFRGFGGQGNTTLTNTTTDLTKWGNTGFGTKWARQWNEKWYSNAVIAYSNYFSGRNRSTLTQIRGDSLNREVRLGLIEDNDVRNLSARWDHELQLNSHTQLGAGWESSRQSVDYQLNFNDTIPVIDRNESGTTHAVYGQIKGQLLKKVSYSAGVRINYFDLTQEVFVEPRLSAEYALTEKIQLKAAYGQYHQFTNRIVREDIQQGSRDFWLVSNGDDIPVSSAVHYIAGLRFENQGFLLDVEGFYKNLDGLTEFSQRISQQRRQIDPQDNSLFFYGTGVAKGLEFLLQKKIGDYTGWISYTLSKVSYDFPDLGDEPFPALHDQTHETKMVNTYKVGRWTLGATWVYGTGKPYTAPIGGYSLTLLDGTEQSFIHVGEKNAFRLPAYHRLDLSGTLDFHIGNSQVNAGLSIFNVYGRKNIWYKEFQIEEGELIETDIQLLGFTPNFFLNFRLR